MLDYLKLYQEWLSNKNLDLSLKEELLNIKDNEEEIQSRFYTNLSFGTAGLRGKLGAGCNRMNKYVVGRATKALGLVMIDKNVADMGLAIAYDCRINSDVFAKEAALVLASLGIKVYLFDSLRPTPELSYAVRYYKCGAGINITASHNPKDYNGYKVYWKEGSQIKSDIADAILDKIDSLDLFEDRINLSFEEAIAKKLIVIINEEVDEAFYKKTMEVSLRDKGLDKSIGIVYTPLNGCGNIPCRTVLKRMGYENVHVVKEQELPDGTFPTIKYPNPEDHAAFEYAEKLARETKSELMIATDPDCDRLAVEIVDENGEIYAFNGNQIGVILVNYVLSSMAKNNNIPKNGAIVKSIVTGEMSTAIAKKYGVETFSVLTGFKNICALPNEWDHTDEYTYIMGYEESIGYNIGSYLRDKDGVSATLILCEAAAYYKSKGKNLKQVLFELYEEFGYYYDNTISLVLEGIEGQQRIARMMVEYRKNAPTNYDGMKLLSKIDYLSGEEFNYDTSLSTKIDVEKTDALKFIMADGSWYALRPSGTEPKIKLYCYSKADTSCEAKNKLKKLEEIVLEELNKIN